MNSIAGPLLILASTLALSACLTIPNRSTSSAPGQAGASTTQATSKPTREELEAQRRAELSRNDPRVEFRPQCEGLFIPEVRRTMFQGQIPVYSMFVLNNSGNRYAVKYDLTFVKRIRNVLVNSSEQFTEEKSFIVRPGTFTQFEIARQQLGAGVTIDDIRKIVVLNCERT